MPVSRPPGTSTWDDPFNEVAHALHVVEGLQDLRDEALGIKTDKLARTFRMLQASRVKQDVVAQAAAMLIQRYVRRFLRRLRVQRLVRKFITKLRGAVWARHAAEAGITTEPEPESQSVAIAQEANTQEAVDSTIVLEPEHPPQLSAVSNDGGVAAEPCSTVQDTQEGVADSPEASCEPTQQPSQQAEQATGLDGLPAASSYFYPSECSASSRGVSYNGALPRAQASRAYSLYEPRDPPVAKPVQQHIVKTLMSRAPVAQRANTPTEIQVSQFFIEPGPVQPTPPPPPPQVPDIISTMPTDIPQRATSNGNAPSITDEEDMVDLPPVSQTKDLPSGPSQPVKLSRGAVAVGQLLGSALMRRALEEPKQPRPMSQPQPISPQQSLLVADMLLAVGAGLGQRWGSPTASRGSVRPGTSSGDKRSTSPVPAWDARVSSPMHRQLMTMCAAEEQTLAILPRPSSPPKSVSSGGTLQSRPSTRSGARGSKQVLHLSTAGMATPDTLQTCYTEPQLTGRSSSGLGLTPPSHEPSQRVLQLATPQRQPSGPLVSSPVMAAFQKLMTQQQQPHSAPSSPMRARSAALEEQASGGSSRGTHTPSTSGYLRGKSVDWVLEEEASDSVPGPGGALVVTGELSGISSRSQSSVATSRTMSSRHPGALRPSHLNAPINQSNSLSATGKRVLISPQQQDTFTSMMVVSSSLPAINPRGHSQGNSAAAAASGGGGSTCSTEADLTPIGIMGTSPSGHRNDGLGTKGPGSHPHTQPVPGGRPASRQQASVSASAAPSNSGATNFTFTRML